MSELKIQITRSLTLLLYLATFSIAVAGEESIVRDAENNYVITYRSYAGEMTRVIWIPSTKIEPTVKSKFRADEKGGVAYSYVFMNGEASRQLLEGGRMVASNLVTSSQKIPSGWNGRTVPNAGGSPGVIVGWSIQGNDINGIKQGSAQNGFGFQSADLPGLGKVELWGSAPAGQSFPDQGPSESSPIDKQLANLMTNNFVSRFVALPKIPVGNPFNAAMTLDALRAHITKDIVDLKLIEPTLASLLDRSLQATAEAARRNSTKAAREHIHDALKLLRKEHADLDNENDGEGDDDGKNKAKARAVDRLAARVIAFDLQYIEKRLKKD
jgi:hypothetical protein